MSFEVSLHRQFGSFRVNDVPENSGERIALVAVDKSKQRVLFGLCGHMENI